MEIKNIIFDFGGVLYDINYQKCSVELAKLSLTPEIFNDLTLEDFIDVSTDFEKGMISSHQFRELLRAKYLISANDEIIDKAWNSMLIGLKDESLNTLKVLKDNFRLTLLSNSNQIHYNYFYENCKSLFDNFENTFFSFQIGMKKPDKNIFEYVCKKMDYLPEQTLFVDDSFSNIESAILAGLNTYHFSSGRTLSDLLHSIEKITHI